MSRSTRIRAAIVLAVWVALATFPEWSVAWESSRFAAGIIRQILIFAIFASSLNLLVGYAGLPSLGHAAFFGGGAYAAAIVAQRLGTDELLVSLGAAVAGAALLALVVGYLAVRAVGIFFLMLTLALAQMVFAIAFQARTGSRASIGPSCSASTSTPRTISTCLSAPWRCSSRSCSGGSPRRAMGARSSAYARTSDGCARWATTPGR
jgi:ABC-type branched-subunit amino acid transport system permease subunit